MWNQRRHRLERGRIEVALTALEVGPFAHQPTLCGDVGVTRLRVHRGVDSLGRRHFGPLYTRSVDAEVSTLVYDFAQQPSVELGVDTSASPLSGNAQVRRCGPAVRFLVQYP